MKNCLVTKLNVIINDESMPVFNGIRFRMTKNNSRNSVKILGSNFWYLGGDGVVFKPISNVKLVVNGSDVLTEHTMKTSDTTINAVIIDDTTYAEFLLIGLDKFEGSPAAGYSSDVLLQVDNPMRLCLYENIRRTGATSASVLYPIKNGSYNIEEYLNSVENTPSSVKEIRSFGTFDGAYSEIKDWTDWTGLTSYNNTFITSGDLKDLPNNENIKSVILNKPGITGDIKYLGRLIGMVNEPGSSSPVGTTTLNDSSIYGTVEDLVGEYYNNGKKSGFVRIYMTETAVTFNGSRLPSAPRMVTVSWSDGGSAPANITIG